MMKVCDGLFQMRGRKFPDGPRCVGSGQQQKGHSCIDEGIEGRKTMVMTAIEMGIQPYPND